MDFLELAKNRFSLRKFSDKKVEKEKIDYILAAMQAAPTAVNFQPQRILVLTDEKELEKVSKCGYRCNAYDVGGKKRRARNDLGRLI